MASFFDILGVVFGILGTVSAVPIVLQWLENRLPQTLLRQLEAVVADIESLLSDLAQHGVLFKHTARREYQEHIASIEKRARKARLRSYQATTYTEQLRAFLTGLSKDVIALHDEAIQLRASICAAAITARDVFTSPYPAFWEPLTTVPVTSPLPEPAFTPPALFTPLKSLHKVVQPLRPALRKATSRRSQYPRDIGRARTREHTPRPRAQSLPPLHITHSHKQGSDFSQTEASGFDDLDAEADEGGLRRRNRGQRKVQFDKLVDVLEFDSPSTFEEESD
ncbi:uncharacterized protein TRAVEDRAFT_50749 [Trametes versicolor FP-101664 SS1]|uniref:uncharacterized protein n=1 Tax=Trametes versicolor (strain FP-101664) TaxID=717944 RepID=UPI0004621A46|nr:uncharacterized protein TRAVEDRAFT_50749 [Trametes versicolor FP-101664 SS1]EIW54611.1 hypothetical protein TRAVEDRAFT_50749 [Trametes versicolor FP-101664 SS1]